MAQYCAACKWYSADGLTHCSTCGAPFETAADEALEIEEPEPRSWFERLGWGLALAAAVVVGGSYLYRRTGAQGSLASAGAALTGAFAAVRESAAALYNWIIGPNGEYKDFVVIALGATALIWLVLWAMARLGRR
jgi:hypothetical protein